MNKFCVFCGGKPENKNKEHILPQWLIELTGEPTRKTNLGVVWKNPDFKIRKFAISAFVFPACEQCNNHFSILESKVKPIIASLLTHSPLSALDFDTLLDWLDKVRTGLWLGFLYLNDNSRGITPNFHINQRISSKDRFMILYDIDPADEKRLIWTATDSPIFQIMPSCFGILINGIYILNASTDFLLAKPAGFPYPKQISAPDENRLCIDLTDGLNKLEFPFVRRRFKTGGTQLFQPMIPLKLCTTEDGKPGALLGLYDNDYIRKNCLNFKQGKGAIFKRERNIVVRYPDTPCLEWIPKQRFSRSDMLSEIGNLIVDFQEELYRSVPMAQGATPEESAAKIKRKDEIINFHRAIFGRDKTKSTSFLIGL